MWRHQIQSDDPVLRDQEWSQSAPRSLSPVDPRKKKITVRKIQKISQRVCYSRVQSGKLNSDNSNVSANPNRAPFPLDLTPIFSYFNSVNSNSNNSNSPLTRTNFRFPKSRFTAVFTPITRLLVLATYHRCHPISSSCRVISKNTKTNSTAIWFN